MHSLLFFGKTVKMCLRNHVEDSVKQELDTASLFASMKFSEKTVLIDMILMIANQINKS